MTANEGRHTSDAERTMGTGRGVFVNAARRDGMGVATASAALTVGTADV